MAKVASDAYAGFWIRFGAFFVDSIILSVLSYFLFGNTCPDNGFCVGYNNWQTLIPAAYYFAFWAWRGATPGKMVFGLKIVDVNGKPINVQMAALRLLGYIVSGLAIFMGFISIAFDEKRQGWHDKIAKTYVVKV